MHLSSKGANYYIFFSQRYFLLERGILTYAKTGTDVSVKTVSSTYYTHILQGSCGVRLLKTCQRCSFIPYCVIDSSAKEGEVTRSH